MQQSITLNEAQRRAVTAGDGPALVLAGAGSGKTRVIVERLVWLIQERGVDPRHLLAMTFTNRAANEMKARVADRLGLDRTATWIGTFHAFGLSMLRREIDRLGRSKSFTVFDETDQLSLMRRLLRNLPAEYEKVNPRDALTWISRLKQDVKEPDPAESIQDEVAKTRLFLWRRYHEALERASAVDFDDLLTLPVRLWEQHADLREKYQRRYRYVLVDEYQDTNHAQYRIAQLLSGEHGNLFVVGDEDQSIYAWRGADIQNILNFEHDFPNAQTFRLEQNYRSTAPILDAANAVVAHNTHRLGKTLRTDKAGGDPVRFHLAADAAKEAEFVIDDAIASKSPLDEIAVLYRTNDQSRLLEEALRRKRIPYVVFGGIRFYARKEIKDLLCYLRLLVNPADDESLRRIVNVPARGIGEATLERFEEYARDRGIPLLELMRQTERDQTVLARAREAAAAFVHLVEELSVEAKTSKLKPLVEKVLERTRYRDFLKEGDEKDYRTRLDNVEEFLSSCHEFDVKGRGGLVEFLQELSVLTTAEEPAVEGDAVSQTGSVSLMTCHNAKGLEFDCVFLVGLEEGLLPHATALDSDLELEEERRLCYVAMTRARKRLTLTAAQSRTVHGETGSRRVSRFVGEIPAGKIQWLNKESAPKAVPPASAKVETGRLRLGSRVRHPKFGRGYVMYTTGSGDNLKARIRFETGRVAMFMVSKTPLELLEDKKS